MVHDMLAFGLEDLIVVGICLLLRSSACDRCSMTCWPLDWRTQGHRDFIKLQLQRSSACGLAMDDPLALGLEDSRAPGSAQATAPALVRLWTGDA